MTRRLADFPPLSLADAARVIGIPLALLRSDVRAGAPIRADGKIELSEYARWVVAQAERALRRDP
jgi:hypothetical protein